MIFVLFMTLVKLVASQFFQKKEANFSVACSQTLYFLLKFSSSVCDKNKNSGELNDH